MCNTDPVRPWQLWLLNLEIEKSRQGDGIEKPGSETDNSNQEECQANTNSSNILHPGNKVEMSTINYMQSRPSFHLKKLTILWKSPGISTTRDTTVVKIKAGDGVSLWM